MRVLVEIASLGTIDDRLAPRDRLTLDREAKEGEAALSDDGNAHAEKRERTHRNQNIGQQFFDDDASALGADDSSRLNELALRELDRGGTRKTTDRGDADDAEGHGHRQETTTQRGGDEQGEHERRERQKTEDQETDDLIGEALEVPGGDPEGTTDDNAEKDAEESNSERNPSTPDRAGKHVASERVGAHEVVAEDAIAWRTVGDLVRISDRQPRGEERRERDEPDPGDGDPEPESKPLLGGVVERLVVDVVHHGGGRYGGGHEARTRGSSQV